MGHPILQEGRETVNKRVKAAETLVSQLSDLYQGADPPTRKRINQALFAGFDVDADGWLLPD